MVSRKETKERKSKIQELTENIKTELMHLPEAERINAINEVKKALHEVSPFCKEPVDCVLWVKGDDVKANDYNPNKVAPPEMKLLEHSIKEDGYTQPIVTYQEKKTDEYEVVDGFHRNRIGKESEKVRERLLGYLPVTVINHEREELKDRIAATIRHNRARGVHGIEPMATIVAKLYFSGWSNKKISEELGMSKDEVLRLKQFTGIGTLFENRDFSKAWDL